MRRRPAHWFPPGPVPPGDGALRDDPSLQPDPGETLDCLSGHWKIFQLRDGHRYSTDDLLTAWYAVRRFNELGRSPGSHLDLGCGIGSVGLLTLWSFPEASLVGVEAQEVSARLARKSLRYNGVDHRAEVRVGDFRTTGVIDRCERFDLITGSPPYLIRGEGRRSHRPQRGPCRFEDRGGVRAYLKTAATHLAGGGVVVWVHATRYLEQNLEAAREAGFGTTGFREVVFREAKRSLVTLFQAARANGTGVDEEHPLTVRMADGSWSQAYREVRREMGFPV